MQSMDLRNQALVKVIYADGELPERLRQQGHDEAEKHQNARPGGVGIGGVAGAGGFNQQHNVKPDQVQEQNPFATNMGVGSNAPGGSDRFGVQGNQGLTSGQIGGQIPGSQMGGMNTMGGQMSGASGQMGGMSGMSQMGGLHGQMGGINGPPGGMQGMNATSGQMGSMGTMGGMGSQMGGISGQMGGMGGQMGGMSGQMGGLHGQGMNSMGGQMGGMNSGFGINTMQGMGSMSGAGMGGDQNNMMGGSFGAGHMSGNQSFDRMGSGYPGAGSHTVNSQFGASSFGQSGYPGSNQPAFGTQSYNNNLRSESFNTQWQGHQGQGLTSLGGGVGPHQSLQSTGYPGMANQQYGTQSQTTVLLTTNQVTGQAQPHWINNIVKPQPKDEIEILREWFSAVDQDNSGSISQEELASALEAGGEKFNFYTVKMMIDMFDRHSRGLIDFLEFTYLFGYIKTMRASFDGYDVHRLGSLGVNEINQALLHAGYRFANPQTLLFLCDKFDKKRKGSLSFENFLELGVYLGSMRTAFQKHGWPTDGPSGYVTPQFEAFVVQELAKLR